MALMNAAALKPLRSPPESLPHSESEKYLERVRASAERVVQARSKHIPEAPSPDQSRQQETVRDAKSTARVRHSFD